jgi:hypothetical protein
MLLGATLHIKTNTMAPSPCTDTMTLEGESMGCFLMSPAMATAEGEGRLMGLGRNCGV